MIIVRLLGGLGNQMFQYCLYRSLKCKKEKVKMDITAFNRYGKHNGYELDKIFKIEQELANKKEINILGDIKDDIFSKFRRKICGRKNSHFVEKEFDFNSEVFELENVYLDGYWQTEKYFKDIESIIKEEFKFKNRLNDQNKSLINNIKQEESVSLHVRRGDYIKNTEAAELHGGICTLNYYQRAINIIKNEINNPKFYIFSDDIEWVKSNLLLDNSIYVDWNKGNKSYVDMLLMSKCKHNIIANSTFSWWGAWLNNNDNKIVLAPKKWFNDSNINTQDIIPSNWRRIEIE